MYIHFIIKPLRLLFELVKFSFYFLNAFNLNTIILSFIFLISLASQLFLIIKFKFKKEEQNDYFGINYLIEKIVSIAIMMLCSISLIFYASHQTGTLDLMIFIIIFAMLYIVVRISSYVFPRIVIPNPESFGKILKPDFISSVA